MSKSKSLTNHSANIKIIDIGQSKLDDEIREALAKYLRTSGKMQRPINTLMIIEFIKPHKMTNDGAQSNNSAVHFKQTHRDASINEEAKRRKENRTVGLGSSCVLYIKVKDI